MGRKHAYATKQDLQRLVTRMLKTGILYAEATGEFKKQFVLAALETAHWNQSRAAKVLGMHRNALVRTLRTLGLDIRSLRPDRRLRNAHSPKTERKT